MKDWGARLNLIGRLAAVLSFCLLGSCGGGYDFTGTWNGKRNVSGPNAAIAAGLSRIELTIKPDGTFDLQQFSATYSGTTYRFEGKVRLQIKEVLGRKLPDWGESASKLHPDIVLTPVDENTIEFRDPSRQDAEKILLRRESQRSSETVRKP